MDKRLLDLAAWARADRAAQMSVPIPPEPRPTHVLSDGTVLTYVGPWNENEADEIRQEYVERLLAMTPEQACHQDPFVHAVVREYASTLSWEV